MFRKISFSIKEVFPTKETFQQIKKVKVVKTRATIVNFAQRYATAVDRCITTYFSNEPTY